MGYKDGLLEVTMKKVKCCLKINVEQEMWVIGPNLIPKFEKLYSILLVKNSVEE